MELRRDRHNFSGEFLLADRFVTDYLSRLSPAAIKLYLWFEWGAQHGAEVPAREDLMEFLNLERAEVKAGIDELLRYELLSIDGTGYVLKDLRILKSSAENQAFTIHRDVKTKAKEPSEEETALSEQREAAVKQINDSFFQGVMPLSFYQLIDRWFEDYKFTPHVIYALFSEARQNDGLTTAYCRAIADNWHRQGIQNYSDLNRYLSEYQSLTELGKLVKDRMNIRGPLTKYQEELIEKWQSEWGFTPEMIDEALSRTTKILNPNLEYVDVVLKNWHEAGVSTKTGLAAYEKRWQEQQEKKSFKIARQPKGRHRPNFTSREDAAEDYRELADLSWLGDLNNGEAPDAE